MILLSSVFVQFQELTLEKAEKSHLREKKMELKRVPKIGILTSILDPGPSQDEGSMGR